MYTEKTVELKSDFYSRYGQSSGTLYFARAGVPCAIMDSVTHMLAFSLSCGVRAYGRACGDVLRILNAGSNECDVRFAPKGLGAQILYKQDFEGISGVRETAAYVIEKLLRQMRRINSGVPVGLPAICDRFGSGGWCAMVENGTVRRVPLPLMHRNVILIRSGRRRRRTDSAALKRFCEGETERIRFAAEGLSKCRTEALFEMMNESQRSIEMLLSPNANAVCAAHAAMNADGVCAARICDAGVVCITEESMTDSVIHFVSNDYERETGYPAGIIIVK